MKICKACGKEFPNKAHPHNKIFCSMECCKTRHQVKNLYGLNHSTSGALSELVACTDLIRKGYEVFRALNPAASCDLIAMKEDKILRIEVRTGNFNKTQAGMYFAKKVLDIGKSDLYAIVIGEQVFYQPELPQ